MTKMTDTDIDLRTLKIRITSASKGYIQADLPVGILLPGLKLGLLDTLLKGRESLQKIDFEQIAELAQSGYTGPVEVEQSMEDGEIMIAIE
ncbi:MAG: hypothetical protein IKS69_08500 [Erysipelotrichaceae bacterium]|nr:hypothetical protein [Erysipelotrichaceae bacterium]